MPLHEPAELNALPRAISEAQGSFAAMELGAGWGPWVVLGGQLARRRGLPLALTGVEGSIDHLGFMRTHFLDNGFDPAAHRLIHAVVGAADGIAQFPRLPDPSADWGAEARFNEAEAAGQDMEEVTCFSLATLLAGTPVLDLIHCDVQGAEADVFEAGMAAVDAGVRRVCIGTHGRGVEGRLLDLFAAHGWVLEDEKPCSLVQSGTRMALRADGVQVWRNPRGI
jgi:FkbM family methyltransferase